MDFVQVLMTFFLPALINCQLLPDQSSLPQYDTEECSKLQKYYI